MKKCPHCSILNTDEAEVCDCGFVFASDWLKWHDPGPGNPFGVRLLDCRPLTWNWVATTKDPSIAQRFVRLRTSDGKDLINATISNSVRLPANLVLPHNGVALEGVVFKADSMEVKWDIYIYNSVFLFSRSWTGDLYYRALATVGPTSIRIAEIECPESEAELAPSHVYFLLGTHAMGRALPHRLPAATPHEPMTMATLSFSLFGRFACYATFDDITRTPIQHRDPK